MSPHGCKEKLAAMPLPSPSLPMPIRCRFCATLTPLKPVHFGHPVNKYMHYCIYLFAGGQGQEILLLKPAVLSQPGLPEARGDRIWGDIPKHGVTSPMGNMHEVGSCGTWSEYGAQVRSGCHNQNRDVGGGDVIVSMGGSQWQCHQFDKQIFFNSILFQNFLSQYYFLVRTRFEQDFWTPCFSVTYFHCQNGGPESLGNQPSSNFLSAGAIMKGVNTCLRTTGSGSSSSLHISLGCSIKLMLRKQGIEHQPGPRWTASDGSGMMILESINITALSTCVDLIASRGSHITFVQEHSMNEQSKKMWEQTLAASSYVIDSGPLDPELSRTGGVATIAAEPFQPVKYQPT